MEVSSVNFISLVFLSRATGKSKKVLSQNVKISKAWGLLRGDRYIPLFKVPHHPFHNRDNQIPHWESGTRTPLVRRDVNTSKTTISICRKAFLKAIHNRCDCSWLTLSLCSQYIKNMSFAAALYGAAGSLRSSCKPGKWESFGCQFTGVWKYAIKNSKNKTSKMPII